MDICLEHLKTPVHILIQSLKYICAVLNAATDLQLKSDSAESSVLALKSPNNMIFSSLRTPKYSHLKSIVMVAPCCPSSEVLKGADVCIFRELSSILIYNKIWVLFLKEVQWEVIGGR